MNIAALISGGVDSAVVVHLLCEQGYKPDLFYIKIGMDGDEDLTCTAEEDIELCTATARKYGEGVLTLTLKDSYYNMRKMVEPHPQVIDKAIEAMKMAGVEPLVKPIRGGTDGARLSFMGLPCPNIFTGGMNFHGRYEYCSLTTMHKAMQVILNLAQLWTK